MKLQPRFQTLILAAVLFAAPHANADEHGGVGPAGLRRDRNRIYHCDGSDGSLWVRGATYKAAFDVHGAQYIPFLGSAAPRNYPVAMHVDGASVAGVTIGFDAAAAPVRSGDTIAFDRGGLSESYTIGLESIEQTFVFETLPARGELVLRIALESELAVSASEGGLELRNERGGVRYGRATAIDALGRSASAATVWTGAGIEIRVASEFVEAARLPLVIDPLVTTWALDATPLDDLLADVVRDKSAGWMTVYEEVFSANDHDVVATWVTTAGTTFDSQFVDGLLGQYWANPALANNDAVNNYLIVAEVGLPSGHQRTIHSRTLGSGGFALGPDVLVSVFDQGDMINPDVGGDPGAYDTTHYLVVWERVQGAEHDIHARYVYSNGTLDGQAPALIDGSAGTIDARPSISKSNRESAWSIVWERQLANGNWSVRGAQFLYDGTFSVPSFEIQTGLADEPLPDVSSPIEIGGQYLVVWQKLNNGVEHNIQARLMDVTTSLDFENLSGLEGAAGSGAGTRDQIRPSVDSDGNTFVLGYAEQVGASTTDYDAYCATFSAIGDQLYVSEAHVRLSSTTNREDRVQVTSAAHSNVTGSRHFVIWDEEASATDHDIEAAFYDAGQFTRFCSPGVSGTIACPCGNPHASQTRGCDNSAGTGGARIDAAGTASILSDSMVLSSSGELSNALSVFSQGSGLTNPIGGVVFGQGVRCVAGSIKRLYTKAASGGSASAPSGADLSIHDRSAALGDPISPGESRFYYIYYRDPNVLGGCPSASTFNSTTSMRATWRL